MLSRWPKFLDLQVKLPDPGEIAALMEMRKMCPGKPATLEEIKEISQETPFQTPFWKGNTTDTNIPERPLSPAEVDVINRKYLELKATFDAMRARQSTKDKYARLGQGKRQNHHSGGHNKKQRVVKEVVRSDQMPLMHGQLASLSNASDGWNDTEVREESEMDS